MVTQGIIELLLKLATPILSLLPNVNIATVQTIDTGSGWDMFVNFVRMALYFFPVDTVITILNVILTLMIVRCIIAFLKTLWAVLPIL